jgi:membrane protease YdiL (CAAX protease family)
MLIAAGRRTRERATPRVVGKVDPILPRTTAERRAWAGLALSAGVTEEITYRGLLLIALATLLPDAAPLLVVTVAAVLFGLAHWYQGALGILVTGLLGGVLAALYLATGSLLLPIALHVLIDLRALLPIPAARRADAT